MLVEEAAAGVVRLVEALFALEAVEALAERSQQTVVVAALVGRPVPVTAGLPRVLAMRIGVGQGAGRFFGLVVEAVWSLCSLERGPGAGFSLLLQLSCHLLCLARTCSHSGRFAQSPS